MIWVRNFNPEIHHRRSIRLPDNPVAPAQIQLGDPPVVPTKPTGPKPKSVGSLMSGYKSSVTKKINQLRGKPGELVWQRNYFEHIIRDEKSLAQIRQYILDNPENWSNDEFYRKVII